MKLNEGYRFVKSFKDLQTYVEYSGEEAATILEYNLPRPCRARFRHTFLPTGVRYLVSRWSKHDPNMMHHPDVSERYNTLMDTIREYKSRFRQCEDLDNYTKFFSLC